MYSLAPLLVQEWVVPDYVLFTRQNFDWSFIRHLILKYFSGSGKTVVYFHP